MVFAITKSSMLKSKSHIHMHELWLLTFSAHASLALACLFVTLIFFSQRFRGTFLDKVHVNVQAGTGGMGNQKYGGIGGKGGDIYMEAAKGKYKKRSKPDFEIKTFICQVV